MFLFAIPAGALADIVDRRRLMILIQILVTVFGLCLRDFGTETSDYAGNCGAPDFLLAFMFLATAAAALYYSLRLH
jgi:MFS family permease